MAYAVEMYFNPGADQAIRSIWRTLDESGLGHSLLAGGFQPHVSLGVCEQLSQPSQLANAIQPLFSAAHPITLSLSSTGTFNTKEGVIFYGVTVTQSLLKLHAAFDAIFADYAQGAWDYYRPGRWTPHCTLATEVETQQIGQAVQIARQTALPLTAQVVEIGIIEISRNGGRILTLLPVENPAPG